MSHPPPKLKASLKYYQNISIQFYQSFTRNIIATSTLLSLILHLAKLQFC
nr:MAG TPA: hypothetical protein [Caudoviricetes sp.]